MGFHLERKQGKEGKNLGGAPKRGVTLAGVTTADAKVLSFCLVSSLSQAPPASSATLSFDGRPVQILRRLTCHVAELIFRVATYSGSSTSIVSGSFLYGSMRQRGEKDGNLWAGGATVSERMKKGGGGGVPRK